MRDDAPNLGPEPAVDSMCVDSAASGKWTVPSPDAANKMSPCGTPSRFCANAQADDFTLAAADSGIGS